MHRQGKLAQAAELYHAILETDANHFDALHLLGVLLGQQGLQQEAARLIGEALKRNPNSAEAHNNLGNILAGAARHEEALACFRKAVSIRPDYAEAFYNLASSLSALDRHEDAIAGLRQALAIAPAYPEAHNNLGLALAALGRYTEAIASHQHALAIRPNFAQAHNNLGTALHALGRYDEAIASYQTALLCEPNYAKAHNNLAYALAALNRYDDALASYGRALAIDPGYAQAHWNESLARLATGDFATGWEKYEWRWRCRDFTSPRRNFSQPLWRGREKTAGKTILLHAEQGFGDTLQFVRYAPLVAATGARVVLEVQAPLTSLMHDLAGVEVVVARGDPLPPFDFHCPLLSLPLALGTTLRSVPAEVPYLRPPPAKTFHWRESLAQRDHARIGLVWSGRKTHKNDRNRSIALARLQPLLSIPGITFVSLQKEIRQEDAEALGRFPQIIHVGDQLEDFSDTAAVAATLDLVISADTAVAHLAGALAKPTWVLLPFSPDWRWLLNREDSPWYPTMRLFRQPRLGDWDSVIERVKAELSRFIELGCT